MRQNTPQSTPGLLERIYSLVMRKLRPALFLCHVATRPLMATTAFEAPEGIEIRYPTREELVRACEGGGLLLSRASAEASLDRGEICTAAFDKDDIVGYTWIAFGRAPHTNRVWIEFAPPYRYGFRGFVREEHRGRRINNALAGFSDRLCMARGFTHAVAFIETHNFHSIRSSKRQPGRKFVGYAGYFSFMGRVVPFRTPAVKRLGFRFVASAEAESTPRRAKEEVVGETRARST